MAFRRTQDRIYCLDSCNGILFLYLPYRVIFVSAESDAYHHTIENQHIMSTIYTWNPSTGFFKKLPDFNYEHRSFFVYGVGYLKATDDYRVLCVFSTNRNNSTSQVAMFSSKTKAWKHSDVDFHEFCFLYKPGLFVKEALHWFDTKKRIIVALDLSQEEDKYKVREMLLPQDFYNCEGGYNEIQLGVASGGKLCLIHNLGDSVVIWLMKECGVHESWSCTNQVEVTTST